MDPPASDMNRRVDMMQIPRNVANVLRTRGKICTTNPPRRDGAGSVEREVRAFVVGGAGMIRFTLPIKEMLRARKVCAGAAIWRYQALTSCVEVTESRVYGADAVRLVARDLSFESLTQLIDHARFYSLTPIVSVYDVLDVTKAVVAGATVLELLVPNPAALRVIPSDLLVVDHNGVLHVPPSCYSVARIA